MVSSTAPKMIGGKQMHALPWLVAGYTAGTVRLFDCNQMEMALKMHPHADTVTAVGFSADG
jgi:WD40 repeat protein